MWGQHMIFAIQQVIVVSLEDEPWKWDNMSAIGQFLRPIHELYTQISRESM